MSDAPAEPVRGPLEHAQHDKSWGPRLKELAGQLSVGDKSVLVALLQNNADDNAIAMTTRGSPNDWFWAHLSSIGWMDVQESAVPESLKQVSVAYAVTQKGHNLLPGLLGTLFRD